MIRLTRTGKIFLAVIVAMHLASITSQSGLLIWLVGLIAGCIAVNVIAAMRAVRHVKFRAPTRILVEAGAVPREPWQLTNNAKKKARLITVERNDRVWLKAPEIMPGQTVSLSPRDVFKDRGVYSLGEASLVSLFPFGLVKAMRDTDSKSEILVYPKLEKVDPPDVRGLDPILGGRLTGPGRISSGSKFAGVRPIQSGDSFKQIHWKSSAKGGGLMVKTYEEELAGRAALLVFCQQANANAETVLQIAGSLALAGLEAGHQIDWHNLNEKRRVILPPFSDTSILLEELARYKISENELSAQALASALETIRPRVAIHFVLSSTTPEIERIVEEFKSRDRVVAVHTPARKPITEPVAAFSEA